MKPLHIAIDGPVAAGKGTVALKLAEKLRILYIETGSMYRAVALIALQNKCDLRNEGNVLKLLKKHTLTIQPSKKNPSKMELAIDSEVVDEVLRTQEVSWGSSIVATHKKIREYLVKIQKTAARFRSVVMEGRDIGTVVMPDAEFKFYLTADVKIRAQRRFNQLRDKNIDVAFKSVLSETKKRDYQDEHRKYNPLVITDQSVVIDTSKLSIEEVVEKMLTIIAKNSGKNKNIAYSEKISRMKEGGKLLWDIVQQTLDQVRPGISTLELDVFADDLITKTGGTASFKRVPGYKWATCISVNDMVVHGVPKKSVKIKEGDIVSIDIGLYYKGFHTDCSWSVVIPYINPMLEEEKEYKIRTQFLEAGIKALEKAIKAVKLGNRVGDISHAIQDTIEGYGYSIADDLVGHGVGKNLHEDPEIPGILTKPIEKTPVLTTGMTLAIEVIYNEGKPGISIDENDGWTIYTGDGTLSGLFERTVALTDSGVFSLT
jgi:cytidylate kinase/methionine aminopeptidase type I